MRVREVVAVKWVWVVLVAVAVAIVVSVIVLVDDIRLFFKRRRG
ncbi:hypothetical protein CLV63_10646 [Murinocardiopsis flavida]|uniref:Uncharacterized protein n=1 Tax=Murinocardiopsis flavida TaxID=645275 RepID=A0A2P8DLB9_9ACTN|nr:hypothetical protein CLV63_10646 [Murinocardiopsis flavida]